MNETSSLHQIIKTWNHANLSRSEDVGSDSHINDESLYELAANDAIAKTSPQTIEHLSSCPTCMKKWAAWRRATSLASGDLEEQIVISYGYLKAAASNKQSETISLKSACGKFELGIYPGQKDSDSAMVALEYIGPNPETVEGHRFIVRECGGMVLLDGTLDNGRMARVYNNISQVDLCQWTIVEAQKI